MSGMIRTLPATWRLALPWRRMVTAVSLTLLALFCLWLLNYMSGRPTFTDAYAYWSVDLSNPYAAEPGQVAYLYSPVVAQAYAPFTALPFSVFYGLLLAANVAALIYLVGPMWALPAAMLPPVTQELAQGNIHLLLAVALVRGAWWAFPLTKLTPSVTWIASDRRLLVRSATIVAALITVSFTLSPLLWADWIHLLLTAQMGSVDTSYVWVPLPLWLRLLAAVGLSLAARRWRWLLAPALVLSLPIVWMNALSILLSIPRLLAQPVEREVVLLQTGSVERASVADQHQPVVRPVPE